MPEVEHKMPLSLRQLIYIIYLDAQAFLNLFIGLNEHRMVSAYDIIEYIVFAIMYTDSLTRWVAYLLVIVYK